MTGGCEPIRLIAVHSPAFPIPAETLKGVDISSIKLTHNDDLWFTEVLWSLLRHSNPCNRIHWIVAGDFNCSVLFDQPTERGNRQVVDRMNVLGFMDCLSCHSYAKSVPTFRHSLGSVIHQLDYCYVNPPLLIRLKRARVPDRSEVFDKGLSDHLPIICEFT